MQSNTRTTFLAWAAAPSAKHHNSFARTASGHLAVAIPPRHLRPCRFAIYLLASVSPSPGAKVQGETQAPSSARAAPPSAMQPGPSISTSSHLRIAACWSVLQSSALVSAALAKLRAGLSL